MTLPILRPFPVLTGRFRTASDGFQRTGHAGAATTALVAVSVLLSACSTAADTPGEMSALDGQGAASTSAIAGAATTGTVSSGNVASGTMGDTTQVLTGTGGVAPVMASNAEQSTTMLPASGGASAMGGMAPTMLPAGGGASAMGGTAPILGAGGMGGQGADQTADQTVLGGTGGTMALGTAGRSGASMGGASSDPGSDLPSNPSGLPEPGAGGVARPAGAPGNLEVLAWAGFTGAMTYTFDDANSTQINNESELLGLGVPFTWYLQTGKPEAGNAFYQRALDAGHELANHTQQHGSGDATNDVNQAQQFLLDTYGVTAHTMAAPNGSTNNYTSVAQQLFLIDRGVGDSLIGPDDNTDLLNLPTYIPPTGAGAAQSNPKADAAQSQGKWQTFTIHGFSGGTDGAYQPIDLNGFVQHVEYVKAKGDLWIGTMEEVGAYFVGRKAVASSSPQTQGDDQVWTWMLPNTFPPGHYVRVTVDGGTLSQDGTPLPWNEHGYYEVALDVGSLTLSP